jgi:spore coat polysaccharide biosynthesis protein SpsF (cytidylyltransferase family)
VRLTGDTPFVPVSGIVSAIRMVEDGADYVETRSDPSTRPNGIDVQAFTRELLLRADRHTVGPEAREHVTPALLGWCRRAKMIHRLEGIDLDSLPSWRLTLDTSEDLLWMQGLAGMLDVSPHTLTLAKLSEFLLLNPHIARYEDGAGDEDRDQPAG